MKTVYCGGGFDFTQDNWREHIQDDWRHRLVLKNLVSFLLPAKYQLSPGLTYGGPFYFEGDCKADTIIQTEMSLIENSTDCIFVLDRPNSLGTVAEMFFALSKNKNIFVVYLSLSDEEETESELHTYAWYAITMAKTLNPTKVRLFSAKNKEEIDNHIQNILNELR